ncbi:MAG: efflux RND transporter periplasmic adaptor subunit [Gammaproteobacteria bacterium]|nr:efflux RND transporter periplasmic adaptor subunit [Gammaproteobacteria bacterium]
MRISRRRLVLAALLAGAAAVIATYWWRSRAAEPTYRTALVTRGDLRRVVSASGTVNPVRTIQVGTYVSGVIQRLLCDFNDRVAVGQLCAKIDPRPYQTIVDQDLAALDSARAQLAKDIANLRFAESVYRRDQELLARHIVSTEIADTARNAYDQAGAQVAYDRSAIVQRLASLKAARVNLDYTNIVSPVAGTVVSRNVTEGQTVAASFQTPTLFLIATDLTQMQVDTNVSESDIGQIRVGQEATFTVEAYPDQTFSGRVVQVRQAPQSVQNVITYDAVIAVANRDLRLMPGMTAAARIVTAEREGALRVPDQALRYMPAAANGSNGAAAAAPRPGSRSRQGGSQGVVWTLVDGRPRRVPLRLGLDDASYTEVLSGALSAGDRVVLADNGARADPGAATGPRPPRL